MTPRASSGIRLAELQDFTVQKLLSGLKFNMVWKIQVVVLTKCVIFVPNSYPILSPPQDTFKGNKEQIL